MERHKQCLFKKCVTPSRRPAHRRQGSARALDECVHSPQGGGLLDCRHCIPYTGTASGAAKVPCPALHSHEALLCNGIPAHLKKISLHRNKFSKITFSMQLASGQYNIMLT